jgi:glycosyltransferase involved in cell wall biosynthesis
MSGMKQAANILPARTQFRTLQLASSGISTPLSLVYFSPDALGGLSDYAHEQASAIRNLGIDVQFLTTSGAVAAKPEVCYCRQPVLADLPNRSTCPSRIARRLGAARSILRNIRSLANHCRQQKAKHVLFGAFSEYLAPVWAPWLNRLSRRGVIFGSVVHDPLRDFIVGPAWWHHWSTACGYSFVREAFVHEAIDLPTVRPMPRLRTTVIPHGPYSFARPTESREAVRRRLQIPPGMELLLAFGHIRDTKNLHLVLEAMVQCPEFYLFVAGSELRASQGVAAGCQAMAARLGVADRCRWEIRHIGADEVGNFFEAADLVLLTYAAVFRSASGVLNAAVHFRKPCLASSGKSNLKTVVESYSLGYWVNPDSAPEIVKGLRQWLHCKPVPNWAGYLAEHSWKRNAELVTGQMFEAQ